MWRAAHRGIVGQVPACPRNAHRLAEAADLVDQPDALRVAARPHATAGDGLDLRDVTAATLGDLGDEVVVDRIKGCRQLVALPVAEVRSAAPAIAEVA